MPISTNSPRVRYRIRMREFSPAPAARAITSGKKRKPGSAGRGRVNGEIGSRLCRELLDRLLFRFGDRGRKAVLIQFRECTDNRCRISRDVELKRRNALFCLLRRVDLRVARRADLLRQALAGTADIGAVRRRYGGFASGTRRAIAVKMTAFYVQRRRKFVASNRVRHFFVSVSSIKRRIARFLRLCQSKMHTACQGTPDAEEYQTSDV